jgi:hypothetical protein
MAGVLISGARHPGRRLTVLLTLLLLAALPGCKRDVLSDSQREEKMREEAIASLREQGGTVTTKNYHPQGNGYVVDLKGAQLSDRTFENLKDLQRVTELDLSKSSLTDEQMDQLNQVALVLLKLNLSDTKVTDAGLDKLTNLKMCFDLNLAGTPVTAAGVERFKQQHPRPPNSRIPPLKVRR